MNDTKKKQKQGAYRGILLSQLDFQARESTAFDSEYKVFFPSVHRVYGSYVGLVRLAKATENVLCVGGKCLVLW